MTIAEKYKDWFAELAGQTNIATHTNRQAGGRPFVTNEYEFQLWASNALAAITSVFGDNSVYTLTFKRLYDSYQGDARTLDGLKGIFGAAQVDLLKGRTLALETVLSGEVLGNFILVAKAASKEGFKDVAAVLISASLEDAFKRYASREGLDVEGKNMVTVINALKAKGLISGAKKSLADSLPDFRDHAMHAEWKLITNEEVAAAIGFVDEFLLSKFSD